MADDNGNEGERITPASMAGPRGRRPWSTILLREWAAVKYPGVFFDERFRLGPTESHIEGKPIPESLGAMLSVNFWYPDGVAELPEEVLCIEAKVRPIPGAVGQALYYARELARVFATMKLTTKRITPLVLFAEENPSVRAFAISLGCRVEVYTPGWIVDYLSGVQFRDRRTDPKGILQGQP